MVSTEVLVVVSIAVAAGLILLIVLIVFCTRRNPRQQEEYALLLSEKGSVMPRVNPEIERQHRLDQAMMNARFYLRSSTYILDKYLPEIGHRTQKQYFLVTRDRKEYMMSMTRKLDKWPIPMASESAKTVFNRILKSLEGHPNVSVPVESDYMVEKDIAVAIRPMYNKGSLKDFIHKARPQQRYADKYNNNYALNPKLIGKFGRQILEGLNFLKFQGFPYYQLHTTNILVDDNSCCLSDMESSLVGALPYLAPFMKHFMDKVDPDIICFGCVLYEMAVGYELESPESYQLGLPSSCPEEVKKVLDTIFNPWFGTPPTIEELLRLSIFSDVKVKKHDYQRNQYNAKERDMIASVKKCILAVITETPINSLEFQKKKKAKNFTSFSDPSSSIPPLSSSISSATLPQVSSPAQVSKPAPVEAAKTSAPPPPPPPPAKGAPPPPPPAEKKGALLDSITGFKGGLKKTKTKDSSAPKVGKVV